MDLDALDWTCPCCGERRRGMPDTAFRLPDIAAAPLADGVLVPEQGTDFCVVQHRDGRIEWFIRTVMRIPVAGRPGDAHGIGVWVGLSMEDFRRYRQTFDDTDQSGLGVLAGRLANGLPLCDSPTTGLPVEVHPSATGKRPATVVADPAHPLGAAQRRGWSLDRLTRHLLAMMPCEGRA